MTPEEINFIEEGMRPVEPYRGNEIELKGGEFNIKPSHGHPTVITIKPMLFAGTDENNSGGWHNFIGYFDSIEHAKLHVLTLSNLLDWCHIVVEGKIKIEGNSFRMSANYPSSWKFKDVLNE